MIDLPRTAARLRFPARLLAVPLLAASLCAGPAFAQDDAPDAPAETAPDAAPAENGAPAGDAGPKTGPPLPRGFVPPPEKPEAFTAVTPLMTEEQLAEAARALDRARYRDVLENGPRDGTEEQVLQNWAAWRVAGLTSPATFENRPQLKEAVEALVREANRTVAGRASGRQAEAVKKQAFAALAAELVKLKENNLVLRIVAAQVLGELEMDDGRTGRGGVRRYGPAVVPLLELYETAGEDPDSLVDPEYAVKLAAARALGKVARTGDAVPGDVEQRAAEAFTTRLENYPGDPGWFQAGLADAVSEIGLRLPALGRRLLVVAEDSGRPCVARAAAAMAIVRLPGVTPEVRSALPDALRALAKDIATNYNAGPAADYVQCVERLEFSFKPTARSELQTLPEGILLSGTDVPDFLRAAYAAAHPVVKHVAGQDKKAPASRWTPIPADVLANLGAE